MGATALAISTSSPTQSLSIKENLELERQSGERHEFINGKIKKRAVGTIKHNLISANIIHELKKGLDDLENMYVFGSDQKIFIPEQNVYVYPDAVVICETPITSDKDSQAIINPLVVIEVLSPSTEEFDRISKFDYYLSLPTFKEYVIIGQQEVKVTSYFREENGFWNISDYKNIEESVFFKSLNISVLMTKIYKKVF